MVLPSFVCLQCGHPNRATARYCGRCGFALLPANLRAGILAFTPDAALGERQRYRIVRALGKGGFGETYLAHDTAALDHLCVVKHLVLKGGWDEPQRRRVAEAFEREARLLVGLSHPGHPSIPDIYEYLPDERALVMKYVTGQSLRDLLRQRRAPLPEEEALRYARDICDALCYMHHRTPEPVLHRDVKPDNILVDETGRVWVVDFGLARTLPGADDMSRHDEDIVAGTPGFTAPEQWLGINGPPADIYALGATLWMLLCGRAPALNYADGPPTLRSVNPEVRPEVEWLIQRAMARDPLERPTGPELLSELSRLLGRLGIPRPEQPPLVEGFVGRAAELEHLARRLADDGVAVITGMAGIGKTSLATMLARGVTSDKLFWHTINTGTGLDDLVWRLAAFLAWDGQPELWELLERGRVSSEQLISAQLRIDYLARLLADCGYLICLDDLHAGEADPQIRQLVDRLLGLARGGQLALLVSTRQRPWFIAANDTAPLLGLGRAEAQLFLKTRRVELDQALTDRLVTITEGNPQLLTLASDLLLRSDPLAVVNRLAEAEHIEDYLLTQVDAGLSAGERAVMASVAALLDQGGSRRTIEALLDQGVVRELHSLAQRHLLQTYEDGDERLYKQHAIVRTFYYHSLVAGERRRLHQRAAEHFAAAGASLAAAIHHSRAGAPGTAARLASTELWPIINQGQARALAILLSELAGAALDPQLRLAVLCAQGEVAGLLSELADARASYDAALSQLATLPAPEHQGWLAKICRGMVELLEQEEPEEALRWAERGLAQADRLENLDTAILHVRTGSAHLALGSYAAATDALNTALELLPPDADTWRANALNNLGIVFCSQGEPERGLACYHEALGLYEATGNAWKLIFVWQNIGIEMEIAGDWPGAAAEYMKALELADRLGSNAHRARIALGLGVLALNQGDAQAAQERLQTCLILARESNLSEYIVSSQSSLGHLWLRLGRLDEARAALDEADRMATAMASRWQLPEIARGWARLRLVTGEPGAALEQATRAVETARELEDPIAEGAGLRELARCRNALGEHEAALAAFAASLGLLDERDPYEAACTRVVWAEALAALGEAAQARPLLRAALAELGRLGAQYDHDRASQLLLSL